MTDPTKAWAHGLAAAGISAFATAAAGAVTLPGVFNASHDGIINFAKITIIPAALAVFLYLKQSPLPASTITVTNQKTTEITKND